MTVDCTPEFSKRQSLMSALIASYLKKSPQERIETLRQNFPAIESLNDRIREKLAAGVGQDEAEKIVRILRLEGILLKEALQAVQAQNEKQGMPWLRKISNELYRNSQSIKQNYPELADALLKYDDALFKQIENHISGMDWDKATHESNKEALSLANVANKIAGRRAAFQSPVSSTLTGSNSMWRGGSSNNGSVVLATPNNSNNGSVWVQQQPVGQSIVSQPASVVVTPKKSMDWKKWLLWLLFAILLGSLLYSLWKKREEKENPLAYHHQKVVVGPVGPISPEAARIMAEDDIELQSGYHARSPAFDFTTV